MYNCVFRVTNITCWKLDIISYLPIIYILIVNLLLCVSPVFDISAAIFERYTFCQTCRFYLLSAEPLYNKCVYRPWGDSRFLVKPNKIHRKSPIEPLLVTRWFTNKKRFPSILI